MVAYIVPSIFFGHILHAKIKTGSILSSPIIYKYLNINLNLNNNTITKAK